MNFKTYYKNLLFLFISTLIISCNSDDIKKLEENEPLVNLISFDKVGTHNSASIRGVSKMINAPFTDNLTSDVDVYTIKYNTTFQDKNVVASGLVVIPKSKGNYPILSFQNGTNTLHSRAPSVNYTSMTSNLFHFASSSGFICVVPDYLGYGDSKDMYHPYLHKKSTTQSLVDILKAVREMANGKNVEAKSINEVYLAGYSQGGWSTMILQKELELNKSHNFEVKASACGAGPYNLETVMDVVLNKEYYGNPYFLGFVFHTMYQMRDIDKDFIKRVIKEPYASKVDDLFNGLKGGAEINTELTTNISELLREDFLKNYKTSAEFKTISDWLKENSVGFWKTNVSTKLFHGDADVDVPFETSKEAYKEFTTLGVNNSTINLIPFAGKDHGSAAQLSVVASLSWFIELKNAK